MNKKANNNNKKKYPNIFGGKYKVFDLSGNKNKMQNE